MTESILSREVVFQALAAQSTEQPFVIDFDSIWQDAGYTRKDNALRRMTLDLIEGEDYVKTPRLKFEGADNHAGLKPQEVATMSNTQMIFLSSDGLDHLMMSARTKQGREARKLFIRYKKIYLQHLEQQFAATTSDRVSELEAALAQSKSDHLDFPFSLDYLHKTSGIVNKSQVKTAVTRDFQEERDYIDADEQIFLNESTFTILIMSFRSLAGTDITALPEVIRVETKRYFEYQQIRRMNRRIARGECPGQTALDL